MEFLLFFWQRTFYIGKLARSLFLQLNCQPNIIMQCRTMDIALSLVQRGLATTLIPRSFFLSGTSSCIQYYQINHPAAVREISVIYRKEHYLTTERKKIFEFVEHITYITQHQKPIRIASTYFRFNIHIASYT